MTPSSLLILQAGQQVGPFSAEAVREMLATGSLSPQDFAWAEGMPEWVTLDTLFPDVPASVVPSALPTNSPVPAPGTAAPSFAKFLADAFVYPFRGDGPIILLTGTLAFAALEWIPKFGLFGLVISVAGWGYLLLMFQAVIQGTAQGEDTLPRWPSLASRSELFEKWFQWLATVAFCFGPAYAVFAVARLQNPENPAPNLLWAGALGLAGAVYFPMAALSVAMFDSLSALNPLHVFRSILAVPGHYLLTLLSFGGLLTVKAFAGELAGAVPYVGALVDQFDALWSAFFLSRVLGGLYRVNQGRLNWF